MTSPFVFSIRRVYVERILAPPGDPWKKGVEYRTRRPSVEDGETILIYETAPTMRVVARASVKSIIAGKPADVWARTREVGGVTAEEFDLYFEGRAMAYALELASVVRLDAPRRLPPCMSPPQSWARWRGPWPLEGVTP